MLSDSLCELRTTHKMLSGHLWKIVWLPSLNSGSVGKEINCMTLYHPFQFCNSINLRLEPAVAIKMLTIVITIGSNAHMTKS